ncbi:MAG: cbb3-type cytochrome c oxidase N-terminal domain-containing protein [Bacteroidota bacterium]
MKHVRGRSVRLLIVIVVTTCLPLQGLLAESGSSGHGALLFTSILTLVLVAIIFFLLVLPEEDRKALGAGLSKTRWFFVPRATDRAMDSEHEYDGIRELDNSIPPWFTTLFVVTIVFGAAYMLVYHVLESAPLMIDEYREEMAAADLQRRITIAAEGSIDENALTVLDDGEALQRGAEEYAKYCVSCHGPAGGGLVGPNLTDDYWIHGGGVRDVYFTIKSGVPEKGMISWELVFTPRQTQEIASFVLSLYGTNPLNAKKPEGERYMGAEGVPPDAAGSPADSLTATTTL